MVTFVLLNNFTFTKNIQKMEFWIFLLFVFFIILYSKVNDLKKGLKNSLSDIYKLKAENNSLKKELESLKLKLNNNNISVTQIESESIKTTESIQEQPIDTISRIDIEFIPPIVTEEIQIIAENIAVPTAITLETVTPIVASITEEHIQESIPTPLQESVPNETIIQNIVEEKETISFTNTPSKEDIYQESAFSIFLKKAEKQFADNWTGILGTAIMVLGIGYLSIYTALKVSPFFRIIIL